jgi:thioredoxin-related protein
MLKQPTGIKVLLLLCIAVVVAVQAQSRPSSLVPQITDLRSVGQLSNERKLPVLILFSMQDCPYCDFIREDYLEPMLADVTYQDKIIIREIHSDRLTSVIDFNGQAIEGIDLAQRYGASLAPTLIFIDGYGRQLVERMVGVTTPDFYGGYLDQAINQSYEKLRSAQTDNESE